MSWYEWLSMDSFVACLVIGTVRMSRAQMLGLALAFGLFDGLATLIGAVLDLDADMSMLPIYLVAVALLALAARYSRALLYALPALLSLDNLFGGAPGWSAPVLTVTSAAMAGAGLVVGRAVARGAAKAAQ